MLLLYHFINNRKLLLNARQSDINPNETANIKML